MTEKTKMIRILMPLLIAAAILSSCGEGTTDRLTSAEVEAYEDYVMSSYFMLRGDSALAESRAAWDYTQEVLLPTTNGATVSAVSNNYPEKGQTTTVTITKLATPVGLYKVENTTTYPNNDAIDHTTEIYYTKDINADGYLVKDNGGGTFATDPIYKNDGSAEDPLYRESFVTVYDNDLERQETVIATLDSTGGEYGIVQYADFNINDSLKFPTTDDTLTLGGGQFNDDGTEWSPAADTDAVWSSMTAYEQEITYNFRSWSYTYHIVGVRYYTENSDDLRTSVTYERGIATISQDADLSSYSTWKDDLFKGRNKKIATSNDTVYIETVIRTSANGAGNKKVKTNSALYDDAGSSVVTFTASYENDEDGVVTSSGAPVAVYY